MDDWWDLGEWSGFSGSALLRVACAFCGEDGHLAPAHHMEKKHPHRSKTLNYDTCRCENCGNLTMVLWSENATGDMANYHALPWSLKVSKHPQHWPSDVGRYWLQAKGSLREKRYDAAAVMARSALQIALRQHQAEGSNLNQEIDNLAGRGVLPPIMREWSHAVRLVGNESAHPEPNAPPIASKDAAELVRFLDFLLEYLYDLPHRIGEFRKKP